jgi:plastocyanin
MELRRICRLAGLVLSAAAVGACGSAEPANPAPAAQATSAITAAPTEAAAASGITLELTAESPEGADLRWDVLELNAPADLAFDVAYSNADDARHDFAVLPVAGTASDVIFKSEMVAGLESATIPVPGLAAGTYDFVCSLHASTMRGTLTVE